MGCMTLTPAQMDRDATAAAARHRAGETDEEQLRRELAEILARSGQVVSEADRFLGRGSDKQVRADLIEELNRMEFDRVLTHPGFHPTRMLEDSFAGYIRKHLWYDSKDAYRRLKIRTTDKFHLSDDMTTVKPTASVLELSTGATQIDPAISVAGSGVASHMLMMEAHAQWKATASSRREETHAFEAAEMLMQVFRLPRPIRPLHADRKVLLDYFTRHETAVRESLRSRITHETVTGTAALAQSLWDDYTDEHITDLLAKPAKTAIMLARWATEDRPLPVEAVRRSFFATVRALGSDAGWRQLGGELAAVHLALEYTANCAHDHDPERRAAREVGRTLTLESATEVMTRVRNRSDHPLGRTDDEIRDRLDQIMEDLLR